MEFWSTLQTMVQIFLVRTSFGRKSVVFHLDTLVSTLSSSAPSSDVGSWDASGWFNHGAHWGNMIISSTDVLRSINSDGLYPEITVLIFPFYKESLLRWLSIKGVWIMVHEVTHIKWWCSTVNLHIFSRALVWLFTWSLLAHHLWIVLTKCWFTIVDIPRYSFRPEIARTHTHTHQTCCVLLIEFVNSRSIPLLEYVLESTSS